MTGFLRQPIAERCRPNALGGYFARKVAKGRVFFEEKRRKEAKNELAKKSYSRQLDDSGRKGGEGRKIDYTHQEKSMRYVKNIFNLK